MITGSDMPEKKSTAARFEIYARFDAADPDSYIMCDVSCGLPYRESLDAMIRLRDHLTARIESAPAECPAARKAL